MGQYAYRTVGLGDYIFFTTPEFKFYKMLILYTPTAAAQLVNNASGVPLVRSVAVVWFEATDVVGAGGRYPLE